MFFVARFIRQTWRCHDRSKCLLLLGLRCTPPHRDGCAWQGILPALRARIERGFSPADSSDSLADGWGGSEDCVALTGAAKVCGVGL